MNELPVPREKVAARLRKIAGQIRGCARMVENEADCSDILTQMAAARGALSAAAALVLTNYTQICLVKEKETGENPYESLTRVFALWAAGPSDAPLEKSKSKKRGQRGNIQKVSPQGKD